MTGNADNRVQRLAELLKQRTPRLERRELEDYVRRFVDCRSTFLQLTRDQGSPLYALDREALVDAGQAFLAAFRERFPTVRPFYAVKSNNHPEIARTLVREGFGLDVSSGLELQMALDCGAAAIIFSGPGKTDDELRRAVSQADRVTVMLDSFGELQRLDRVAGESNICMRTGVRVTTQESGIWRKFGVPLESLGDFFAQAARCRHVRLSGMQFHLSWNLSPDKQVAFITRLGLTLREMEEKYRRAIDFLDVGGGYWPSQGEWLQPSATPEGALHTAAGLAATGPMDHYKQPAVPLEEFADRISQAIVEQIPSDLHFALYCEPGRWLCHKAMHILVTVVDRKAPDLVITDAGTNAVGWERFESDYFPVINLTRPSLQEKECLVAGSLCTPHDLWGYSYFGEDIQPGDVLLIPDQGAYTYSLKQEFIKPLPTFVDMAQQGKSAHISGGKAT
jgi:diaminopimelate decarboxylase